MQGEPITSYPQELVTQPVEVKFIEGWLFKKTVSIEGTLDFIKVSSASWWQNDIQIIPTHRITGIDYGYRSD